MLMMILTDGFISCLLWLVCACPVIWFVHRYSQNGGKWDMEYMCDQEPIDTVMGQGGSMPLGNEDWVKSWLWVSPIPSISVLGSSTITFPLTVMSTIATSLASLSVTPSMTSSLTTPPKWMKTMKTSRTTRYWRINWMGNLMLQAVTPCAPQKAKAAVTAKPTKSKPGPKPKLKPLHTTKVPVIDTYDPTSCCQCSMSHFSSGQTLRS